MERLRYARGYAKKKCTESYAEFKNIETQMLAARNEWDRWRTNFEEIDTELAEIDGRLKVIPSGKKAPKPTEPVSLTMDQIKDLAGRVGIKLDLGEECDFE